eukprot:4516017-Amphidinium_carterae.1
MRIVSSGEDRSIHEFFAPSVYTTTHWGCDTAGAMPFPSVNQPHGDGDQIVWDEEQLVVVGAPCPSV